MRSCVHSSFLKGKSDERTREDIVGAFTFRKVFIGSCAHYLPEIASNNEIIVELIDVVAYELEMKFGILCGMQCFFL